MRDFYWLVRARSGEDGAPAAWTPSETLRAHGLRRHGPSLPPPDVVRAGARVDGSRRRRARAARLRAQRSRHAASGVQVLRGRAAGGRAAAHLAARHGARDGRVGRRALPARAVRASRGVAGLADGVHWYDPVGHALARVGPPAARDATTLVVTGVPWRTGWRYAERG